MTPRPPTVAAVILLGAALTIVALALAYAIPAVLWAVAQIEGAA